MNRLNILLLDGDLSRGGGTERMTQILSSLLSESSNISVYVVSLNPCLRSYYELAENVTFLSLKKGNIPILSSIWQLCKTFRKYSIDILINVDTFLSLYTIPLKLFSKKLKVVSWEMFNLENDLGISWSTQLRQFALRWSDYYVCLTHRDVLAFKEKFSIKKPITYIYNPYEQPSLNSEYNIHSKKIVTAGHFFYTKGYDLAAEVARIVLHKHKDWKWFFYGDGVELEKIKLLIKEYQLEEQVVFAGRTKDISEIYNDSSIYVMTSRLEGFGLVLLEAKSYNLPTIAFDCPSGPNEIIDNNLSGFLIPAFDIQSMADKIESLINDPCKRLEFAHNSQNNLYKFTKDIFLSKWNAIINELKEDDLHITNHNDSDIC